MSEVWQHTYAENGKVGAACRVTVFWLLEFPDLPLHCEAVGNLGEKVRTNFVLIDYESVQPEAIALLNHEYFKVIVFVGANQTKVTFEIASVLQQMGERVEYVKITGNGKNALDFHIAFYIGQIATKEPEAYFHIISKDTGFDPLIQHLKSKQILACRSSDIAEIPIVKATNSTFPAERLELIISDLQRRGASRPRTAKTLTGTINSLFQKQLAEQELSVLLDELQKQGWVTVKGTKVSYALPS
jgi:hypothetical protein